MCLFLMQTTSLSMTYNSLLSSLEHMLMYTAMKYVLTGFKDVGVGREELQLSPDMLQ